MRFVEGPLDVAVRRPRPVAPSHRCAQNSIVTLNRTKRGLRICVGCSTRPVAIILLERCAGVGVEEIQQIDGDVRARAADVEKLADAEVDLIDAVRIFLSWQQEVDLLAGREDAVRGKAGAVPSGVAPTPNVALGWKRMMPLRSTSIRGMTHEAKPRTCVCQDSTL